MNDIYDDLYKRFNGLLPIKRENPKSGQSSWYYMMPVKDFDEFNPQYEYIDVPNENSPNPRLQSLDNDNYNKLAAYPGNTALPTTDNKETLVDKTLRNGEYASSALQQGLSAGWADEIEGVMGGIGYALGSLNSNWNKTGETALSAARRGYNITRDARRNNVAEGYQNAPVMMQTMTDIGSIASPMNHTNIMGNIPILNYVGEALQNPIISGSLAGLGASQGDAINQINDAIIGGSSGYISNSITNPVNQYISYKPQGYVGNYGQNITQPVAGRFINGMLSNIIK